MGVVPSWLMLAEGLQSRHNRAYVGITGALPAVDTLITASIKKGAFGICLLNFEVEGRDLQNAQLSITACVCVAGV